MKTLFDIWSAEEIDHWTSLLSQDDASKEVLMFFSKKAWSQNLPLVLRGILSFLRFFWELPQNLLAIFLIIWLKMSRQYPEIRPSWVVGSWVVFFGSAVLEWDEIRKLVFTGVGLGQFAFVHRVYKRFHEPPYPTRLERIRDHEVGHTIQSAFLGPLYLIAVGVPSLINNLRARVDTRVLNTYYSRYPEKWADDLGGVRDFERYMKTKTKP